MKELADAVIAQVSSVAEQPALAVLDAAALSTYAVGIATRARRLVTTITK